MSSTSAPAQPPRLRRLFSIIAPWVRVNLPLLTTLACGALFLVYAAFRQRYIFGVDSFGYYQLGWNFAHGTAYLSTALPAAELPALIPFGFSLNHASHVVPNYPPGFPLLITIGHWLSMPMLVTPALGVVSCLVLFRLIRQRASAATAWWLTLAWAFMPLTVFGSTMMMSDLVAATTLLGALLAWRTQRAMLAAWLLGLAFAVRPTNVLFLLPFALELRFDRTSVRLLLHLVVPCGLFALYNHLLYGAPWRTGYGNISADLQLALFPSHFAFYLRMTPILLSPVVALLALAGLRPWTREKLFLLCWPLVFMLFFANWAGGGIDRWWWARFVLPGLPAFYLLAADGLETVRRRLDRTSASAAPSARFAPVALAAVLLAVPIYSIVYGVTRGDLWNRDSGKVNYDVARFAAAAVPPDSLIGSVELAADFYLYTRVTPFVSVASESPDLVGKMLAAGRPVYLLVEPWNADNPSVLEIFRRFHTREIARYEQLWNGLPLYEITPR